MSSVHIRLLILISILITGVSFVSGAGDSPSGTPFKIGNTSDQKDLSSGTSVNNMHLTNLTTDKLQPVKTAVTRMEASRTNLTSSPGQNTTTNNETVPLDLLTGQSGNHTNTATNQNESLSKYNSLGDIIKAKDWKALGEYTCKMKTENPAAFDESDPGSSDKVGQWNSYFNQPAPVTISYPCCG